MAVTSPSGQATGQAPGPWNDSQPLEKDIVQVDTGVAFTDVGAPPCRQVPLLLVPA